MTFLTDPRWPYQHPVIVVATCTLMLLGTVTLAAWRFNRTVADDDVMSTTEVTMVMWITIGVLCAYAAALAYICSEVTWPS